MVRLKAAKDRILKGKGFIFQFHYGTIKRLWGRGIGVKSVLFQFHYGTIKSPMDYIKTELKTHFNSTMVRLKDRAMIINGKQVIFQFHYGTIKSLL